MRKVIKKTLNKKWPGEKIYIREDIRPMVGKVMKKDTFDELVVVKRSGQRVDFNGLKIAVAIKSAFDSVYPEYDEKNINKVYENVLKYIEDAYAGRKTINVEDIQDIIETQLRETSFKDVYESFSDYRQKRALSRKVFTTKAQHKFVKAMEKIASDNAAISESSLKPNEIIFRYGRIVANEFTKSYIIDNKFLRAHEEGNIYINDLEDFPLGIIKAAHPIMGNYLDRSNSVNNLTSEIVSMQTEVNREINIPSIDKLLENWTLRQYRFYYKEYIANYSKLLGFDNYLNLKRINEIIDKEVAIKDLINDFGQYTLSEPVARVFKEAYQDTLLKLKDILVWKIHKLLTNLDDAYKIGISVSFGTNETYAGYIVNEALLNVLEALPPFKRLVVIFKATSESIKEYQERVTDMILKGHLIAISFPENDYNKGPNEVEYFASGLRIYENDNGENTSSGRMIIGETSINMARLGLKYKDLSIKAFYNELDECLELIKNELLLVFETIGNKTAENYRSFFNGNILDDEKLEAGGKIRKVIKHSNLNIGLVGFKECITVLEKEDIGNSNLITEILKYLNKKCSEMTNETRLNFSICEPVEAGARKALIALDTAVYGGIKGITDKEEYGLISELSFLKDDYKKLGEIQKLIPGGNMIKINITKSMTGKKIVEIINEMCSSNIGFATFETRKESDA